MKNNLKKEIIGQVIQYIEYSNYNAYGSKWSSIEGYCIFTESGNRIVMGISDSQQYCENWGVIDCPDDLSKFKGAKITNINAIGEANGFNITEDLDNVAFISVDTDKGQFQFAVYNEHNGYYGHSVSIFIDDKEFDDEYL